MNLLNLKELAEEIAIPVRHLRYLLEQIEFYIPKATVWAFGSRVKWSHRPESDLDLAVNCNKETARKALPKLSYALDESDLPFKVQIADFNRLPANMQANIKKSYVVLYQPQEIPLPSGWKETTLGKVCSKIGSGATPRGGQDSYKEEGISLIRSQNVLDLDFTYSGLVFIDKKQADDLANVEVQKEDVLINITGDSVARVCMVPDEVLPARVNQHVSILRANSTDLNPYYLKYYLINRSIKQTLLIMANSGATRNALTKGQLENFPILLPPPTEQKAIAAILSSFDDKMELLRRQNKTLEQIARTIFKEWFVYFTVNGKKLKVNSKTGLPEGWRMGKVADLCSMIGSGGTPSTSNADYYNGNINWFSTKELQDNFVFESEKKITEEGLKNSSAKFFPKGSVVMALYAAPTVGRLGILGKESAFNQAACGFVADEEVCCNEFVYLFFLQSRTELNNLANGAAQQNINVGIAKNFPSVIPAKDTMQSFKNIVVPIFSNKFNNSVQIQTLSKLRDTVLPKLMKGEIRVEV